jgi:Calcineurin-like phosphoesterase
MKIIAVPDIHHSPNLIQLESAIADEAPDVTVFLGDYFDNWNDTPADAARTATWLAESLALPNRVHLFGNHDLPYRFPGNRVFSCPGPTQAKLDEIQQVVGAEDWAKLKLAHWEGDWLFTHAGWSRQHCHGSARHKRSDPLERHQRYLDNQIARAWEAAALEERSWVFANGFYRGGEAECGGLTWCDVREFESIPVINQVFGHTPLRAPQNLSKGPEQAWAIDTNVGGGVRTIARIVDGVVSFREIL